MKIGEYIICKNELHHLDAGLKELIKLDFICILDTGSTDGTYERLLELEKQYSHIHVRQKVYNPFYFDVARNDALDFAAEYAEEGDGLFTLDLDEYASDNFVDIIRPQCEAAVKQNALCLHDQKNCWHWQGHKFSKNYKGFYHIHETILTLDGKTLEDNVYLRNVSYFHNQDKNKPRNYRKILREMVAAEPNCLHYLINAFDEENLVKNDINYLEWLRKQIIINIMNNKDDVHYRDYSYLAFAASGAAQNIEELIRVLEIAEEDFEQGIGDDSRAFHLAFIDLLNQLPVSEENNKKIESEFLGALKLKTDLGWGIEVGNTDEKILNEFLMGLFYNKKDPLSAAFYAQQLYLLNPTENAKRDFISCDAFVKNKYGTLLGDNIEKVSSKVLLLQNLSSHDLVVVTPRQIEIKDIRKLLDLKVKIFLNI